MRINGVWKIHDGYIASIDVVSEWCGPLRTDTLMVDDAGEYFMCKGFVHVRYTTMEEARKHVGEVQVSLVPASPSGLAPVGNLRLHSP